VSTRKCQSSKGWRLEAGGYGLGTRGWDQL
jgi:hypothetical protein